MLIQHPFKPLPQHITSVSRANMVGQPMHHSHPHLMKEGEVTPGITATEYALRRARLAESIDVGSAAVAAGYALRYATGGIFYPFHQNTDFLYLTGFDEQDAAMILEKSGPQDHKFTMYVRPRDHKNEVWDGPRSGLEGAIRYFGADQAYPVQQLPAELASRVKNATHSKRILSDLPTSQRSTILATSHSASPPETPAWTSYATFIPPNTDFTPQMSATLRNRITSLENVVAELRLIKSDAEIEVMRQSGKNTGRAFVETMAATKPNIPELVLYSIMEHGVRKRGSDRLAYVPVVASGTNALTLHYVMNKGIARDGELILMDAGGEYAGYASDVTRTWPVSGKFTKAQRDVYESVLRVQKKCIERCTESHNTTLDDLQTLAYQLLQGECQRMFGRRIKYPEMNQLYPHHVGHWLGLDVHDTGCIPRTRKLKKGMVVTIEPGLYIPVSDKYPKEYQGIGVRIEDDIAVGTDTPLILTAEAPKEVDDIEAVCAGMVGTRDITY